MYEFFVEQILIYQNAIYLEQQHVVAAAHAMLYGPPVKTMEVEIEADGGEAWKTGELVL